VKQIRKVEHDGHMVGKDLRSLQLSSKDRSIKVFDFIYRPMVIETKKIMIISSSEFS